MESPKSETESSSGTVPTVSYYQRMKSESGSFVTDLRNRVSEFIHTPMDEHKACLRKSIDKVSSKIFKEKNPASNEAESSVSISTTAAK